MVLQAEDQGPAEQLGGFFPKEALAPGSWVGCRSESKASEAVLGSPREEPRFTTAVA